MRHAASGEDVVAVLTTAPDESVAHELADRLVGERLVACANLVPRIRSIYRWEGNVREEAEALLVLKSTRSRLDELKVRLGELHPYDVPEVIVLAVEDGSEDYLAWVRAEVEPAP